MFSHDAAHLTASKRRTFFHISGFVRKIALLDVRKTKVQISCATTQEDQGLCFSLLSIIYQVSIVKISSLH